MKILTPKVMAILVALTLMISGCDKTTDPSSAGDKPVFPSFQISTPAFPSDPNDQCGTNAYVYATLAQGFVQSSAAFTALPGQNVNGVWTWTFTEDGVTETLTAQKQGDGSFLWKLVMNGTDTNDGTNYSNWTAMEGTNSADGNTGSMTIYDDSPTPGTSIALKVSWRTITGGVEVTIDEYSGGQQDTRAVVVSNTNGSGAVSGFSWNGSAWVTTGFNATWPAPNGVATCG